MLEPRHTTRLRRQVTHPCNRLAIVQTMRHAPPRCTIYRCIPAVILALIFPAFVSAQTTKPASSVKYLSTVTLGSSARDQNKKSFKVTGLSGIVWMQDNRYLAVMDNSNHVVALRINLHEDGKIQSASIAGGLSLDQSLDFEGITVSPHEKNMVLLSQEGEGNEPPDIRKFDLKTGQYTARAKMPVVFAQRRGNLGLESLTMTADGGEIWTANEEALSVDGDTSTKERGTTVRLVRIIPAMKTYAVSSQFAYETDPIPTGLLPVPSVGKLESRSGVSDLVALPDGRLLVLERSFLNQSIVSSLESRIYLVDFSGATDINSNTQGLKGQEFTPVGKTLLWSGSVGNLEGLALGPQIKNGNRTLIGVTDGNGVLGNSVVSFELDLKK